MPRVWGQMPTSWQGEGGKGFSCLTASAPPVVCPGCRRCPADPHPWGCPVLVRLCAQLLATCDPDRSGEAWRAVAVRLAAAAPDPWHPAAEHWRAVAAEPAPPGPLPEQGGVDEVHTPDLIPAGDGLREAVDPVGASRPHAAALLTPQTLEAIARAFPGGHVVCPTPLAKLFDWTHYDQESP